MRLPALLALCALASPLAAQDVVIPVDATADGHAIDPRIYGVAFASPAELQALNAPLNRYGGNTSSRYNWEQNADNRAFDWYFESLPYASATPGEMVDTFVAESEAGGAEAMVTIPTLGWLADVGPARSRRASFSIAKYGAQTGNDWQWFADAGNGVLASSGDFVTNDPTDASLEVDVAFQQGWVQHLADTWGTAASGGLRYYILDNEPSIWHSTHRDVHPVGATMAEVKNLMLSHSAAIRAVDPGAIILGPEEWGWSGYLLSGYDLQWGDTHGWGGPLPDRTAHGDQDVIPWMLDRLKAHDGAGPRTLDVLSVHYYPQGGEYTGGTSRSMQLLRNRSTRSLWDPAYVDESWIQDTVRLVPRLREWVAGHYPGLATGITEYNWGAEGHINGATAQADVLGIFGREGLDLATRWTTPASSTPTFKAMQMFRNYDGLHSTFGDWSVRAQAPDPDTQSAFAAVRTSDGALTVMLVRKDLDSAATVRVALTGFPASGAAQVFQLTSAGTLTHLADAPVLASAIDVTLPAQSLTLLVVPPAVRPALSAADLTVSEGGVARVPLTLVPAPLTPVTVSWATGNGTALAGTDYTAKVATLTFAPGTTRLTANVPTIEDALDEDKETFAVAVGAVTGATVADGGAAVSISDDDPLPSLSIADRSVAEGQSSTRSAGFTVSLSAPSGRTVTVQYTTADGTAVANGDYWSKTGTLTIAPGATGAVAGVTVKGDTVPEADETFSVTLGSPVRATLGDAQATGTIRNDDP